MQLGSLVCEKLNFGPLVSIALVLLTWFEADVLIHQTALN